MRYYEISGGIRVPVSQEEQEIIDLIKPNQRIAKSEFDERQQEVARIMVGRGLLNRESEDGSIYLRANSADVWRN